MPSETLSPSKSSVGGLSKPSQFESTPSLATSVALGLTAASKSLQSPGLSLSPTGQGGTFDVGAPSPKPSLSASVKQSAACAEVDGITEKALKNMTAARSTLDTRRDA